MKHVLILIDRLEGHRQIYCHVLTEVSLRQGFRVTIAAGGLLNNDSARRFPYVERYRGDPRVSLVDVGATGRGEALDRRGFASLAARCEPDVVIFPEADSHLGALASSALPLRRRFRGRMVGVFIRSTNYIYQQSRLSRTTGVRRHLPRPSLSDPVLFHEFLMPRRHPVDAALCLDENFVDGHRGTHTWLPDIYKPLDEIAATFRNPDRQLRIERLDEFCERNSGRFRLFYFGTAQGRRGYATLLKLARDEDACFVHCGQRNRHEEQRTEVMSIRDALEREGRLLETDRFEDDPVVIDHFFGCADRMVLPYTGFWGSSGVMLQALEHGQPVLVAHQGLMGWRVSRHSLGMTLAGDDYEELKSQFRVFRSLPASDFQEPIRLFMDPFRPESIEKVVSEALLPR